MPELVRGTLSRRQAAAEREVTGEQVSWVVRLDINAGRWKEFERLTQEMVEAARLEPGTLVYERFADAGRSQVVIFERYRDSAAATLHLEAFREKFGRRQSELAVRSSFWAMGEVSPGLREILESISNWEHFSRMDGL